jgi:hypothetical protein
MTKEATFPKWIHTTSKMTLEEVLFLEYASLTNRTYEGGFTT